MYHRLFRRYLSGRLILISAFMVLSLAVVSCEDNTIHEIATPENAELELQVLPLVTEDPNSNQLPVLIDPTQWYVSTKGDDANDCHTWNTACRNIQEAVNRAVEGDTVHIAAGTFKERVILSKTLKITGDSMTTTIIDADQKGRPVTLDSTGLPVGLGLELSNLSLTNGLSPKGGGIAVIKGTYVVLTNVQISGNTANTSGGGIYGVNTTMLILNSVTVSQNYITGAAENSGSGGGIYFGTGVDGNGSFPAFFTLTINGSRIESNHANWGGGLFANATVNIMDTTIILNIASKSGGGIYSVYSTSVGRSIIQKNKANFGGGIFNGPEGAPSITPGMVIFETDISENQAAINGGGIANQQGMNLTNTTISNNRAGQKGGGVYNQTISTASGISTTAGKLYVINSTISGNISSSKQGGGIWSGGEGTYANLEALNVTIAFNQGTGLYFHQGLMSLTNVLLANNTQNCSLISSFTAVNSLSSDGTCPGFIEDDPKIADLADNGGVTKTHALLPGSPARDTGIDYPSLFNDQRGNARPLDSDGDGVGKWDIGAYEAEFTEFALLSPTNTPMLIMDMDFVPERMVPCRQGPAFLYAAVGMVTPGVNYPLMGISTDSNWYQVEFTPAVKCWVRTDAGKPDGDPQLLPVIPVIIITITITPTLTPTIVSSAFDCTTVTDQNWCVEKYGAICEWKPLPPTGAPGCVNK